MGDRVLERDPDELGDREGLLHRGTELGDGALREVGGVRQEVGDPDGLFTLQAEGVERGGGEGRGLGVGDLRGGRELEDATSALHRVADGEASASQLGHRLRRVGGGDARERDVGPEVVSDQGDLLHLLGRRSDGGLEDVQLLLERGEGGEGLREERGGGGTDQEGVVRRERRATHAEQREGGGESTAGGGLLRAGGSGLALQLLTAEGDEFPALRDLALRLLV